MKIKTLIALNTSQLGGAERSIILQFKKIDNVDFGIPIISESDSHILVNFIRQVCPNSKIFFFDYPVDVYKISRTGSNKNIFFKLIGLFRHIFFSNQFNSLLQGYDCIWANGNKIAFVTFLTMLVSGNQKSHLVWHFRDYPSGKLLFRPLWLMLSLVYPFKITLVANSFSVLHSLKKYIYKNNNNFCVIYNPSGLEFVSKKREEPRTIGVVAMLAPWKGIMSILVFANLFREKLNKLGITSINIYGSQIYQTEGKHSNHYQDLIEYKSKFKLDNVHFLGNCPNDQIYNEIDILIHSSIEPEPFGRVIIEAFSKKIPVVSTGLGGAGELIECGRGIKYDPLNLETLYDSICQLILNVDARQTSIEQAFVFAKEIDDNIAYDILTVLRGAEKHYGKSKKNW